MRRRSDIIEAVSLRESSKAPPRRALQGLANHERTSLGSTRKRSASRNDRSSLPPLTDSHASRKRIAAPRQPLRVVVVEDEAIIAMEIEMTLQDLGAEVVGTAMTATEAVRLAEQHRPDCATMDISIKGDRDGVSAAIEIYETLGIRSIFVSAYGNEETRARAAPAQPFCWVKKPFDVEELRSALDRVLNED